MAKASFHKGDLEMKNQIIRASGAAAIFLLAALVSARLAGAQGSAPATFTAKCAACHGADGKGATAVGKSLGIQDLASPAVQSMSDADLTQIIAKGKDKMPAYGDSLKDADVKDLVAYVRALAAKK